MSFCSAIDGIYPQSMLVKAIVKIAVASYYCLAPRETMRYDDSLGGYASLSSHCVTHSGVLIFELFNKRHAPAAVSWLEFSTDSIVNIVYVNKFLGHHQSQSYEAW